MSIFSDCIIPKSNSGWLPLGQRPRWHKAHDNSHRLPGPVQTHHTCGETQERWQCHQCAQIVNPCELFTPHLIDWCKLQKVKGLLHGLHQNISWHKTSAFALLYKHDVRNIRGACGCELHHIVVFGRKGPGFWSECTRGGNPSNWHREHPREKKALFFTSHHRITSSPWLGRQLHKFFIFQNFLPKKYTKHSRTGTLHLFDKVPRKFESSIFVLYVFSCRIPISEPSSWICSRRKASPCDIQNCTKKFPIEN